MASIVIKEIPESLHRRLKEQARLHHRSMTKEAIALLEEALKPVAPTELPPPVKLEKPISDELLLVAREDGRA